MLLWCLDDCGEERERDKERARRPDKKMMTRRKASFSPSIRSLHESLQMIAALR
jgi:hypothetical protein